MEDQNAEKLTFRDKVIKCLLKFENYEADLRSLIEMYISVFGEQQAIGNNVEERRKVIFFTNSVNISKYFENSQPVRHIRHIRIKNDLPIYRQQQWIR